MSSQNTEEIIYAYHNLIAQFTSEHIIAFLQACWLCESSVPLRSVPLDRMIYHDGDAHEVYTKQERYLISCAEQEAYVGVFDEGTSEKAVPCKMIALNLDFSPDKLLDSIALMKIINKAFDSFNIYLFSSEDGIAFGCSCIRNSSIGQDCIISPYITDEIDWDSLSETFLYRAEAQDFYGFYSGIISTILSIKACFTTDKEDWATDCAGYCCNDSDDESIDYYEDSRRMDLNSWVEYNAKPLRGDSENKFSIDSFERELNACMSELEYIRPSHQNSIEVLFEAQRALESSQSIPHDTSTMADTTSHINTEHFAMLDDPITLLKLLKAKGPFSSAPPQGGQHG